MTGDVHTCTFVSLRCWYVVLDLAQGVVFNLEPRNLSKKVEGSGLEILRYNSRQSRDAISGHQMITSMHSCGSHVFHWVTRGTHVVPPHFASPPGLHSTRRQRSRDSKSRSLIHWFDSVTVSSRCAIRGFIRIREK